MQAPNVKVYASSSGKCTKAILNDWYNNLLKPNLKGNSVLLLDAYGGFNAPTGTTSNTHVEGETSEEDETIQSDEDSDEGMIQFPSNIKRIPR